MINIRLAQKLLLLRLAALVEFRIPPAEIVIDKVVMGNMNHGLPERFHKSDTQIIMEMNWYRRLSKEKDAEQNIADADAV